MEPSRPVVSIGLPVFNGGNYLDEAIRSIRAQTMGAFELLISDNASTDDTADIGRRHAAEDPRIRYERLPANLGAAPNYDRVFARTSAPYFKWAAHDDVMPADMLERCLAALAARPDAVLAMPECGRIYGDGRRGRPYELDRGFDAPDRVARFERLVCVPHRCIAVFGLVRREVMARTPLHGRHVGSDRNLLAELGLHGPLLTVPGAPFLRRSHAQTSLMQYPDEQARLEWYDATLKGTRSEPVHRVIAAYLASIDRVPMAEGERAACREVVRRWVRTGRWYDGSPVARRLAAERAARATGAGRATTPPRLMSAVSEVPPPTSTTMFAEGSLTGR